jgi:hypothetical protein
MGGVLLEKEVMFIENIQLDRDGEWEKEKKKRQRAGRGMLSWMHRAPRKPGGDCGDSGLFF